MRLVRIRDDDACILERDFAVAVFKRVAVKQDRTVLLAHAHGELIHDAAVDADEFILSLLRELHHLHHVQTEMERILEDVRHEHLERSRGRKACARRQRAVEHDIKAVCRCMARLDELIHHAHRVVGPVLRLVVLQVAHWELDDALVGEVHGIDARLSIRAVSHDRIGAERNRAGEHVTAIVVRVLTDEVYTSR